MIAGTRLTAVRPAFALFREPARLRKVAQAAARTAGIVALLITAGAIGLGLYAFNHSGRIYEGVSAGRVNLSGLTPSEARSALSAEGQLYLSQPVALTYDGRAHSFVPSASGISLDIDGTIAQAMSVGRTGSVWRRSRIWAGTLIRGVRSDLVLSVNEPAFEKSLASLAPAIARAPVNAYVDMSAPSGPAVVPEKSGVGFDIGTTSALVLRRLSIESNQSVEVVAPAVPASITAASLQSSLTPAQAIVSSPFTLSALGQTWTIAITDLQKLVSVDPSDNSVRVNRTSVQNVIEGIAGELDSPAKDAQLYVTQDGALAVSPARRSVKVSVDGTTDSVLAALSAGRHEVDVDLMQADPAISDRAANEAKTNAQALVAKGLKLTWKGGSTTLTSSQLLASITIDADASSSSPFKIGFSPEVMTGFVESVADKINVDGKDPSARIVDGKIKVLSESVEGQAVDVKKSVGTAIAAATAGKGSAALTVAIVKPKYSSADLKGVTVSDLLGESSTDYSTATDAKRTNVEVAAKLESGWLVAPGGVFSYDEYIGAVEQKQGFVTGLGILSDPTTGGITTGPVVGGGICQVSTTIFQAAFWAGMDVVERYSHPYWIAAYGNPPHGMFGLDAMVDVEKTGSLDMQFKNMTSHWIAVVLSTDGSSVVAQIKGTNEGWNVDVQQPVISNYFDPDPGTIYTDSPEMPSGEQRQVESSARGFDASVRRVITDKSGKVIDDYTMTSTYVPSQDRVLVGTGPAS